MASSRNMRYTSSALFCLSPVYSLKPREKVTESGRVRVFPVSRCYSSRRHWPVDGPRNILLPAATRAPGPGVGRTTGEDCAQCSPTAAARGLGSTRITFCFYQNSQYIQNNSTVKLFADDTIIYHPITNQPYKRIWTPYNGGSQTISCTSTHKNAKPCTSPTNVTSSNSPTPYTTSKQRHSQIPRYTRPQHPKIEHSRQQDCTESKHNFSLPPQKHSHIPTQNQTPRLHNTSIPILEINMPASASNIHKVETIQRRSARHIMHNYNRHASVHNHAPAPTPTYTTTTPPALQNHPAIQNDTPTSQHPNCHLHHTTPSTRNTQHYILPYAHTHVFKTYFFPSTIKIWNNYNLS